jgi:hypothetical protein
MVRRSIDDIFWRLEGSRRGFYHRQVPHLPLALVVVCFHVESNLFVKFIHCLANVVVIAVAFDILVDTVTICSKCFYSFRIEC